MKNRVIILIFISFWVGELFSQNRPDSGGLIHIDSLYENKQVFLLNSLKYPINDTLTNNEIKERIKNFLGKNITDVNGSIKNETNTQLSVVITYQGLDLKLLCNLVKNGVELELYDLGYTGTDYHMSFFFTKNGGIHTIKRFNEDFISMKKYFSRFLEEIKISTISS